MNFIKKMFSKPTPTAVVDTTPPTTPTLTDLAITSAKKRIILEKVEKQAPHLLDLTKKSMIVLEKNNLTNIVANVVLVLDASASMWNQYNRGDVQLVLDRIVPLSLQFDYDGKLETYAFAEHEMRLSDVKLKNISMFVETDKKGWHTWMHKLNSAKNNEPVIMRRIIDEYKKNDKPTYVIFVSDGGIDKSEQIKKLIIESSQYPIFWQFVGIGGSSYGILEDLDNLRGGVVDNCNFFAVDGITKISDDKLYSMLLNEFPEWIKKAKAKNIIK